MATELGSIRKMLDQMKRWFKKRREPEAPEDPYAYVTAPRKPRTLIAKRRSSR